MSIKNLALLSTDSWRFIVLRQFVRDIVIKTKTYASDELIASIVKEISKDVEHQLDIRMTDHYGRWSEDRATKIIEEKVKALLTKNKI